MLTGPSGRGAAWLVAFFRILKCVLLLFRNLKFCEAAIQAYQDFRKHPDDRFIETIQPTKMQGNLAVKAVLLL